MRKWEVNIVGFASCFVDTHGAFLSVCPTAVNDVPRPISTLKAYKAYLQDVIGSR